MPKYKIEITLPNGPVEVDWNDDDTVAIIHSTPLISVDIVSERMHLFQTIVNFCRRYKATKVECNKI